MSLPGISRESSLSKDQPTSLASPALAGGFFTTVPPGKPHLYDYLPPNTKK